MFIEEVMDANECPKRLFAMLVPVYHEVYPSLKILNRRKITTPEEEVLRVACARNLPFASIQVQAANPISPRSVEKAPTTSR
jgi:hypothetical protein